VTNRHSGYGLARAAGILAGGTAAGQLIGLLFAPVLARVYSPAEYGEFAVFFALVATLGSVASLRYELAIALPIGNSAASMVFVLSSAILVCSSISFGLLGALLVSLKLVPGTIPIVILFALGMLVSSAFEALARWLLRRERFISHAAGKLVQGAATPMLQVGLGFTVIPPVLGLSLGFVLGRAVGFAMLIPSAAGSDLAGEISRLSLRRIRFALKRYRALAAYSTAATLAGAFGGRMPVYYFALVAGAAQAGMFAMANFLLMAPVAVVSQAIAQVILVRGAKMRSSGGTAQLTTELSATCLRLGLPVAAFVAIAAPAGFRFVLGPDWAEAGSYARWMAPWALAMFVGSPLSMLPAIHGHYRHDLLLQTSLVITRAAALSAAWAFGRIDLAIPAFSTASAFVWLAFTVAIWRITGVSFSALGQSTAQALGAVGVLIGGALAVRAVAPGRWADVATVTVSGVLVVGLLILLLVWRRR
jgi:O-antigen/teichoic acid export membrane protein